MTFDASINPIAYEDDEAVFINTEYETWNLDHYLVFYVFQIL